MITPVVIEVPRALEPITRDTFVDVAPPSPFVTRDSGRRQAGPLDVARRSAAATSATTSDHVLRLTSRFTADSNRTTVFDAE